MRLITQSAIVVLFVAIATNVDAQLDAKTRGRRKTSKPGDDGRRKLSTKTTNTCVGKGGVEQKQWKTMTECCPCCTQDICDALLADDEGNKCERGDDCYKTAFEWAADKGCEAELAAPNNHWFDYAMNCAYDDTENVDESGGDSFMDCCEDNFLAFGCDGRRELFEGDHTHNRHLVETDNGVTAHVETESPDRLAWLNQHVEEMKKRMETPGSKVPRNWDPLFKAYFENVKDIRFQCAEGSEQNMRCTSEGFTQCAQDLIKAHASYHHEISKSLEETGDHRIADKHAVPESCK